MIAGVCSLTALTLSSCSDKDDPQPEPPRPVEVTAALSAGESTSERLTFTLTTSDNADRAAYVCLREGEAVPDAATLMEKGVAAQPGSNLYEAGSLEAATTYVIAAVAGVDEYLSEVATLEMTTQPKREPEPEPEYEKVEATSTNGSEYYGSMITGEVGTAQYYLTLGTVPWAEDGDTAIGAGTLYRISMHAAPSDDPDNPVLAPGTYTLGGNYAAGTFDTEYSSWVEVDKGGMKARQGTFIAGEIRVEGTGDDCTVTARLEDDLHRLTEVTWKGRVEWKNMIPGGKALSAQAFYYGKSSKHPDSDRWIIQFYDRPNPSWIMTVECYAQVSADVKRPEVAAGTYNVASADATASGSIAPGIPGPTSALDMGSHFKSAYGAWYVKKGKMDVSLADGVYSFVCAFKDADGTDITVRYDGELPIDMRYTPEIEHDMDITLDRQVTGKYYGQVAGKEIYGYLLCLGDTDFAEWWSPKPTEPGEANFVSIKVYSSVAPVNTDIVLPEGTYTLSRTSDDFVSDYYDTYLTHWDEDHFKSESTFQTATVVVEHTPDGYRIVLDGIDKKEKSIRCLYEGAVTFENASGVPLPFPDGTMRATRTGTVGTLPTVSRLAADKRMSLAFDRLSR